MSTPLFIPHEETYLRGNCLFENFLKKYEGLDRETGYPGVKGTATLGGNRGYIGREPGVKIKTESRFKRKGNGSKKCRCEKRE